MAAGAANKAAAKSTAGRKYFLRTKTILRESAETPEHRPWFYRTGLELPLKTELHLARIQSFDQPGPVKVSRDNSARLGLHGGGRLDGDSGQGKVERGALPLARGHPHPPAIPLDHPFANRQADSRAGNGSAVQAFEHFKDLLVVFRIDADSVVRNREMPLVLDLLGGNVNAGRLLAPVLNGISYQVLEKRSEVTAMRIERGEFVRGNGGARFLDGCHQVRFRVLENGLKIYHFGWLARINTNLSIGQEILKQFAHACGSIHDIGDIHAGPLVELARITFHKELRVHRDHPKRLLQIVTGGKREALQVIVGSGQRSVGQVKLFSMDAQAFLGQLARVDVFNDGHIVQRGA